MINPSRNDHQQIVAAESSNLTKISVEAHQPTNSVHKPRDMYEVIFGNWVKKRTLSASVDEMNRVTVKTEDGYELKFSGAREEWTIISPEKRTTRIWGDPHVVESDGDKWDFIEQSSFLFGDNKVTVETEKNQYGASYTKTVTIYGKTDRFTITDIDINAPKVVRWTLDSVKHDKALNDGDTYQLTRAADGSDEWKKTN